MSDAFDEELRYFGLAKLAEKLTGEHSERAIKVCSAETGANLEPGSDKWKSCVAKVSGRLGERLQQQQPPLQKGETFQNIEEGRNYTVSRGGWPAGGGPSQSVTPGHDPVGYYWTPGGGQEFTHKHPVWAVPENKL